jgi:hypothetical protein
VTPLIGQAESWLTWTLVFVGIVGLAWLVAQAILAAAKSEYPYDDDL